MIEAALAKKFIEQVTKYTDYNINIMNEKGIIIASCDPKRIGTFHEVAYYIVKGTEDLVITSHEGDYPSVKPGINMIIYVDGKREGVVGITGEPKEIKPIALITKMAIEAMLKYEKQQTEVLRRQNRKEQFISFLTHDAYVEPGTIRNIAKELQYSEQIIRIPILCKLWEVKPEPFLDRIKAEPRHSTEDISIVLDESHVLIFKTVSEGDMVAFADYKYRIADYLSSALRWLLEEQKEAKFYIGSFQSSFTQYYYAYRHCTWLEETVETESVSAFFYDYAGQYIRSLTPANELQRMFHIFEKELSEQFLTSFLEIAEVLMEHNYSLVLAAKELYIHKNTLLYRYNKIKDTLNINPLVSARDRSFMEGFYNYLIREH